MDKVHTFRWKHPIIITRIHTNETDLTNTICFFKYSKSIKKLMFYKNFSKLNLQNVKLMEDLKVGLKWGFFYWKETNQFKDLLQFSAFNLWLTDAEEKVCEMRMITQMTPYPLICYCLASNFLSKLNLISLPYTHKPYVHMYVCSCVCLLSWRH